MEMVKIDVSEITADAIRQHRDIVRGHDAVHPDRSECGGVGMCGLMRAEVEAEQAITEYLAQQARRG